MKTVIRRHIRKRAPNFTARERALLLRCIVQYEYIIENKKTDAQTSRQKDDAWYKVAELFNSQSPESYYRNKDCLKKCYDNIKNNARKGAADEKEDILGTGADESSNNPVIVYGLQNPYEGESITNLPLPDCSSDHTYVTVDEKIVPQDCNTENEDWDKVAAPASRHKTSTLRHHWTRRRRPIWNRSSSSLFNEENIELVRIKREVYEAERERIELQIQQDNELFELERQKLELDIKIKMLELDRLKKSV